MNQDLSPHNRSQQLQDLKSRALDLLIIGGGIVGAAVARDAALRGLKVGLVERNDFAFGTSSRSSRLLHGGLRYLTKGQIRLVREASREKRTLHRIAPHLSEPLAFIVPTYRKTSWPRWKLALGTKIYDLLSGGNHGRSSSFGKDQLLKLLPKIRTQDLTGGVRYFDALTMDARLVIDTLRSAVNAGATVCNYTEFKSADRQDQSWVCQITDQVAGETFELRSTRVVNATGPWTNKISQEGTSLRVSKGVHLIFDRKQLAIPDAVVLRQGKRVLGLMPWGDRVIVGTTDTAYDGPIDNPRCEPEDQRYILDFINNAFEGIELQSKDVLSTYAGLRPLIDDGSGESVDASREHCITETKKGWVDVVGGKLTNSRQMAQEVVDLIASGNGSLKPCATADQTLLSPDETAGVSSIIPPAPSQEAVEHYCNREWALNLEDVMVRRTSWRHYQADHVETARQVAAWMAQALEWDKLTIQGQLERYLDVTSIAEMG